ncbi:hypothetical protein PVAND_005357 [Polypedilum vanderplanki]|uniref:Leucine rich repeat protein n=1 Tax=Polypedilum vanderplanki TaxID=319348 RepID=A0A9J6C0S6_POLVA|nr:hypothetical protein PVAND_005357 [Polypedilum vanderplanki]
MKFLIIINFISSLIVKSAIAEQMTCEFVKHTDGYNCEVKTVFDVQKEVTSIDGDHRFGKGNSDVEVLFINDLNKSKYVPTNVCSYFPNLYKVDIYGSSLVELRKDIFEGCSNLTKVVIKYVKFKTLNADLFTEIKNLTHVVVSFTTIEELPAKLFEKNMDTLKYVDLSFNMLKVINTELPTNLTLLSLMNNECIDEYFDQRSTTRANSLTDILKEVKNKCGTENQGIPMELTYSEVEFRKLKEEIDKNNQKIKTLETNLQEADAQLGMKIVTQNIITRAMKSDIETNKQEMKNSIDTFRNEINRKQEDFSKLISKQIEEIRQLKVKLESNDELKNKNDKLKSDINQNKNFIITGFVLQFIIVALIIGFVIVYRKFYSSPQRQVGPGLLNHDSY